MPKPERVLVQDVMSFVEDRIHQINNHYSTLAERDAATKYTAGYQTQLTTEIATKIREIMKMLRWLLETERGDSLQAAYREQDPEIQQIRQWEE